MLGILTKELALSVPDSTVELWYDSKLGCYRVAAAKRAFKSRSVKAVLGARRVSDE